MYIQSDLYSIGLTKLIKDKNLKEMCKKGLAPYNERCTYDELRKIVGTLLTPGDGYC